MYLSWPATFMSLAALSTLASGFPTFFKSRAGGPAILPIPSTCNVTNILPAGTNTTYIPGVTATNATLYSSYYPSFTDNKTEMALQCLEQCYGYGTHTECLSAYWAENVTVPVGYHGSPGGQNATACILFNRTLTLADFDPAPAGQAPVCFAGTLSCPKKK